MKPFKDKTTAGNEPAIRRGKIVPHGGVNLAFSKSPALTPENNIVIVDTSRIVSENSLDSGGRRKLYYADAMGVLQDESGNQLIEDEYPVVSDVFTVDENWSVLKDDEYTDETILPFRHVSRHFHIDFVGLTPPGDQPVRYKGNRIRVVDAKGRTHSREDGSEAFLIMIAPARANLGLTSQQHPYRVYAYVDTETNEDLYLTYNKVEVQVDGTIKNQELGYRELLNPLPYFDYRPEESEVIDPINRKKSWYSTRPINLKKQILNEPLTNVDGYQVYVPRKAVGDPRIFQLFRWRVSCEFSQPYKQDETRSPTINCGVVITNSDPRSRSAYAFYNLQLSNYNATAGDESAKIVFQNPIKTSHAPVNQQTADYWYVNLDTISYNDLKKFDILIWSPFGAEFDFGPYADLIWTYTHSYNGTMFVDTNNGFYPHNMYGGIGTTAAVSPITGGSYTVGPAGSMNISRQPTIPTGTSPEVKYFNGDLGGWRIDGDAVDSEIASLTYIQTIGQPPGSWRGQYISVVPRNSRNLVTFAHPATITIEAPRSLGGNGGQFIFSTIAHLSTCSALFSHIDRTMISANLGPFIHTTPLYNRYVNSTNVEGAMKFLFNVCMVAAKSRALIDEEETQMTPSTWSFASPWYSSWVINAGNDVLSSNEKAKYNFRYEQTEPGAGQSVWKRRLKSSGTLRTMKEHIDEAMTPSMVKQMEGALRTYKIEVTNSRVKVPTASLGDKSYPDAWTTEWSPQFKVSLELGPHVIREEEVQGDPDVGVYTHRMYPDKPYAGRVRTSYSITAESNTWQTVNWTARGTATETFEVTTTTPDIVIPQQTTPATQEPDIHSTRTSEVSLSARGGQYIHGSNPALGTEWPAGISSWQDHNYYTGAWGNGLLNWPYAGFTGRYQQGSSGDAVRFIQDALNRFATVGFYSHPFLHVDGYFGGSTYNAVRAFQIQRGARFVDGVVDAETWSLIAYQLKRGNWHDTAGGWYQFYNYHWHHMNKPGVSDVNLGSVWTKRSWVSGGPAQIWDLFQVELDQDYDIHGVTLWPEVYGDWPHLMWQSIDIRPAGFTLNNYNSVNGFMTYMGLHPHRDHGQRVNFSPRRGRVLIVGVGQDRAAGGGFGSARSLGIKDVHAHAMVSNTVITPGAYTPGTVTPGYTVQGTTTITSQTRTIDITDSGQANVYTQHDVTIQALPRYTGPGRLSDVVWNTITTDSSATTSTTITSNGLITMRNLVANISSTSGSTIGRSFPEGTVYYSTDEARSLNRIKVETGYVNKTEGVKLLCDANRNPIGFPSLAASVPASGVERHFTTISIETYGSDPSVVMGFYDVEAQEFVTNGGLPEMSYSEYTARGMSNIYIAVLTTYEVARGMPITSDDEANFLPYRYAMPVYGVYKRAGTKITLEPLAKNLGPDDVWPVAVRTGKFLRTVEVRAVVQGRISGYLSAYQGTQVRAYYGVPEAEYGGWSTLYGPPNADVKNEFPLVLDDDVLQVRQAPILLVRKPTTIPGEADPMSLVLKLYMRASYSSPWVEQPPSAIRDYNASSGEIFLKTALTHTDPGLLRVDYTTARGSYYFKKSEGSVLNLNPYPGHTRGFIGSAITIYMVPEYVKDSDGKVIEASVQLRTLRFTTNLNIFDPIRPEYDPLAIQLGTVYISTAIDVNDVVLLDTRKRGGGASDSANVEEIVSIVRDASTYWDINYGSGVSYQKGGFVIIRLPAVLKNDFNEAEVIEVIERNVAAGVRFKIEDLEGNDWA